MIINILLTVIPSLALAVFFYRRLGHPFAPAVEGPSPAAPPDSPRRSRRLLALVFLLGFFIVIPAGIAELAVKNFSAALIPPALRPLWTAFVTVAMIEEGAKFLVIRLVVFPRKNLRLPRDTLIFAVCAGLGFALFENIIYSLDRRLTILIRGFTAVILHGIASGLMGFFAGRAQEEARRGRPPGKLFLRGYGTACFIHGLYDYLLFLPGFFPFLTLPLLLLSGLFLRFLLRRQERLGGAP
ncbi:MAG: PrsW family intramembrane metalloprotease [Spirochaetales bacterium]|nr:PrsW family intramembrane metalloprotease [Spirochaetales bacterium]